MKYKKLCKCCGKEFETNSSQKLYCDRNHYLPCPICGTLVLKTDRDFTKTPKCCSSKCAHVLRQSKFKPRQCLYCGDWFNPKSGVALICDKTHYQKCEICGKEFVRTPATDNDRITTCSHECTKEKLKRNSLKKYGTEHPMQSEVVQKNFHAAMKAKYGVEHALQIPGKIQQQQKNAYHTNMEHWGVPYACLTEQCLNAQGNIISSHNREFGKLLAEAQLKYCFEHKIDRFSYDLYIPEQNTLIELNPTYTHSSMLTHWGTSVSKYYHITKTRTAETNGYRCIHVFDWDDWDKIVNLVKPKTNVYARNCEIYRIHRDNAIKFLNVYDLQGSCRGQLLFLGLVKDDKLLQIMSFGKPRYNKKYDVELLRFCTHPDYRIVGGASKLFYFATRNYGITNIISYCDIAKFEGHVHERIGMRKIKTTPPQEIWSKGTKYITANLLRSHGFDQLFGTNYGKGSSNERLMLEHGWLPVYDCGQLVFEYRK